MDISFQVIWVNTEEYRADESYGRYTFKFLRTYQTVFQSDCTILHSYKQCMRVTVFPSFHQLLVSHFNFSYSNRCVVVFSGVSLWF